MDKNDTPSKLEPGSFSGRLQPGVKMSSSEMEVTWNESSLNVTDPSPALSASLLAADWGFVIRQLLCHVIVVAGLIGNCLTFFVMKSKALRHKSYSHYLCALAIFDSVTLVTREMRHLHDLLTYFERAGVFGDFSPAACKIFSFTECVSCLMSSWLVVTMALERVLVFYVPFRKNVWCTQRGAVTIVISLFVIFSYSQVFRFVMVTRTGRECEGQHEYMAAYVVLHVYVYQICLAFILPVVIVFAANISVLRKICQVERTFRQNENSASTRLTRSSSGRSKTTRMLLIIGFVYVLTQLPGSVLSLIVVAAMRLCDLATAQALMMAAVPWYNVLFVLFDINYAVNFYIYVLAGKKFRLELRRLFRTDRLVINSHSSRTREEFILS